MASARPSPATATACETTAPWRSTTVAVLRPATTGSLNTSTTWRGGVDGEALAEGIDRCRMLWAEAVQTTTARTNDAPSAARTTSRHIRLRYASRITRSA